MKNLTLIFKDVEQVHLGKDVFLFPYYLGKKYNMEVHIVYPQTATNGNLKSLYRGVFFHPLVCPENGRLNLNTYLPYLQEYACSIDLLMVFHARLLTEKICIEYKKLNPNGKIYLKLDQDPYLVPPKNFRYRNPFRMVAEIVRARRFTKAVDYVSVESEAAYERILKSSNIHYAFQNKLHIHSNGFDEELLSELGIRVKSFYDKENIMITVGRLGTAQKNTTMMLDALSRVSLKDWKVYLIGTVEKEYEKVIDCFFIAHPELKEKIIFTGSILDKKNLWDFYNRSKVFLLSSDYESFALVLTEAYRFGNYIVTTPVGAFSDVVKANNVGESVSFGDVKSLALSIQNIIDGKTYIDVYSDDNMRKKFSMNSIVDRIELFLDR